MALKVPTASALTVLQENVGLWNGATPLALRLFQHPYVPNNGTILTDLVEANFTGYTPQPLTSWVPPTTVNGRAQTQPQPITFTKGVGGSGNQIGGYFVTDNTGKLLWLEADPAAPVPMVADGSQYIVQVKYTLVTEF